MENRLDFVASLVGILLFGYGILCLFSQKIWVGLRGYGIRSVYGTAARNISISYILGGVILGIVGIVSWIFALPREVFGIICLLAGSVPFFANMIGSAIAK
jgi:hypothetical protein